MTQWLIDTNVIIDYSKNRPAAVSFVEALPTRPCASVISVTEIIQGVRDAERPVFERMFEVWEVLPIDHRAALLAGEYLLQYRKSHQIGMADAYIAATAQLYNLSLATLNLKDFPMINDLERPY